MHGASGINSSHFIVVGGPGAYVGMSSTDLTINPVCFFSHPFILTCLTPVHVLAALLLSTCQLSLHPLPLVYTIAY